MLVGGAWLIYSGIREGDWPGLAAFTFGAVLIIASLVMKATFWRETKVSRKE